jgi:DNA-binding Lrp family transcriptional regulator
MQKIIEPTSMHSIESAYIMINCEVGSESSVMEQLKSIPGIKEVRGVFGNYDVLVKIQAQSIESLRDVITYGIRKIPQICCTTTIMCSKTIS